MQKLTKYKCEFCKILYDTEDEALICESKGKENLLVSIGTKVRYRDDWNGGMGTCYDELEVIECNDYGHFYEYELGADGRTYEFIDGNEEFKDKCHIIE